MRLTGFCLVPGFASKAQMIQGQPLDTSFADVDTEDPPESIIEEMPAGEEIMARVGNFLVARKDGR